MPARFFLNPLVNEVERRLQAPQSGAWIPEGAGGDFLAHYAHDIQIPEAFDEPDFLERVPSLFAWPIQFSAALEDKNHALHRAVTREWRGLLGVFALQSWLGVRVEWTPVQIPEPAPDNEPRFITMLRNQLPMPADDWRQWWLCRANGRLIGVTSPWSVVYTPADCRCPDIIPFQKGGRLVDPLSHYEAIDCPYEIDQIGQWIALVLGAFANWGMKGAPSHAAAVQNALEQWAKEADAASTRLMRRGFKSDVRNQTWYFQTDRPPIATSPYRHFSMPVLQKTDGKVPESSLILAGARRQVIALSEAGIEPTARVFRGIMGAAVDLSKLPEASGPAGWETRGGTRVELPYVIPERAFFPPRLAAFAPQDVPITEKDLALPLTPAFFELFSFKDKDRGNLAGNLKITVIPGQEVVAELRLPLVDGGALTVKRRYDLMRDVVRLSGNVAFSVWPDFYTEDWKDNYAAYAGREDDVVVAPFTDVGTALERSDPHDPLVRIWESDEPLIGFALFDRAAWGSTKAGPLGVLLRGPLTLAPAVNPNTRWRVGVDFGTTSSHIMVDTGQTQMPLDFHGRTSLVFARDTEGAMQAETVDSLHPASTAPAPFTTLLAESPATIRVDGGPARSRTIDRVPWFTYTAMLRNRTESERNMFRDVKWHGDTDGNSPLRDYLRALVRLTLAEARARGVGHLTFEWSYPLSLPRSSRQSMAEFWSAALPGFHERQPAKLVATAGVSESEAACRFLAENFERIGVEVHAGLLSIIVDVGGGSTDFGFWKGGKLVDQMSMKLAGNAILGPLCKLPSFFDSLALLCTGEPWDRPHLQTLVATQPAVVASALLTELAGSPVRERHDPGLHRVARHLFDRTNSAKPPWSYARTVIHIFFTGLAFLAGLVARQYVDDRNVKIYLGGRGASLLTWVSSIASDRKRILAEAVQAGLGMAPAAKAQADVFGPVVYPVDGLLPKEEVVRGLLSSSQRPETPPKETTMLVECVWGEDWSREVTLDTLNTLDFPKSLDAGYMASFLNQFLPRSTAKLNLDDANLKHLTSVDAAAVQQLIRMERSLLQPVFAYELHAVLMSYLSRVGPRG